MAADDINLKRFQLELQGLRETSPTTRTESLREFGRNSKISSSHVAQMEGRKKKKDLKNSTESSPTIVMLHRYLQHCGSSLGKFFTAFEKMPPDEGLTESQQEILHTVRSLLLAGEDVERRLQERIEDVKNWLASQPAEPTGSSSEREALKSHRPLNKKNRKTG